MGKISFQQGQGNQFYNIRGFTPERMPSYIDQNRIKENWYFGVKSAKRAYKEFFDEAVSDFNAHQKRKDRCIADYYTHIKNSKNGCKLFYEVIVQQGSKYDFENNPELREVAKQCLIEYAENFEKRNPNLKLIGAYIHMDETSPHMHLDYIPVASGYTRGFKTRNSLSGALMQMGFSPENESRKDNASILWSNRERKYFKDICIAHGLEVEEEKPFHRPHLTVEEYKIEKERLRETAIAELREELYQQVYDELKEELKREMKK